MQDHGHLALGDKEKKAAKKAKAKKKREQEMRDKGIVPYHCRPSKIDPNSNAKVLTAEEREAYLKSRPDLLAK